MIVEAHLSATGKVYYATERGLEEQRRPLPHGGCMEAGHYQIGQLATALGLNTKLLRYDAGLGLLASAARTAADHRRYTGVERGVRRFVIEAKGHRLVGRRTGTSIAVHVL